MGRRKPAAVIRKISFDPEVDAAMQLALGRRSMSDFVNDAVTQRLARWESPGDFIARKRETSDREPVQVFDPAVLHESGWPRQYTDQYRAEVGYALQEGTEELKDRMQNAWSMWGVEGEYTDQHLQATLQWYREQKKGGKK